jgi:hypothetical protein
MTVNPAPVFKAAFADFKLVKTRSCAQLIFEVPIEEADAALQTLGGLPRAATEVWAGIARIDPKKPASDAPGKAPAPKERRPFKSLPLSQQAAIRCQDEEFRRFLVEREGGSDMVVTDAESTAATVRDICGVASRSEIREQNVSGALWRELDSAFLDWKHDVISYEGIAR